jgi:hypothetical protein
MKICEKYDHLNALEKLKNRGTILAEIESILNHNQIEFGKDHPSKIKSSLSEKFNHKGWADKVKVDRSKLTINYLKSKVGVCIQLGNVARTYADILKLSQLHYKQIIDIGIIVVPHKLESKKLGTNYAQYERLSQEVSHFKDIIKVPILVIGLID